MKKLFLSFVFMFYLVAITNAQFTKAGGGIAISSGFPFHNMSWDANRSGIIAASFKGIYELNLPFHISPSFTYFYPHITQEPSKKTTVSTIMFDVNGHYVFNTLDKFELYGLAGIDILFAAKKEAISGATFKETENVLGLNLGIGTYMKITEQFDFYGEAKYLFNNKYNQLMINAGVLINLDWLQKKDNTDN